MAWFRKKMWLAVEGGWAGWIDTPNSGADASTSGWGTESTFLNGGGYADHSWGTHKRYTFEWSDASTRQAAQFMQSLRNGAYGKGLIHFIEPTIYETNILPARIAQPSLMLDDGGRPLVYGVDPTEVTTSNWPTRSLPIRGVRWDLSNVEAGYRGADQSVYIPIPEGYTLFLGAVYSATGSGGIFVRQDGLDIRLPEMSPSSQFRVGAAEVMFSGGSAVRLWVGKKSPGESSVSASALTAILVPNGKVFERADPGSGYGELSYGNEPYGGSALSVYWNRIARGDWVGGMGNSGVKFNGTPTMVHNTGVNGGQVGFAASFIETGAWN